MASPFQNRPLINYFVASFIIPVSAMKLSLSCIQVNNVQVELTVQECSYHAKLYAQYAYASSIDVTQMPFEGGT